MATSKHQAPQEPGKRGAREALTSRALSFRWAYAGLVRMLREPNFRIQLVIGIVVLIAAALFRLQPAEWLALILVSVAVLVMEMLNTVIEAVVDLASPGYHPRARMAKDAAAGAVLLTSLAAVVVGLYIFGPHLLHLLGR